MPAVPTVLPFRSAGSRILASGSEMIEVSGSCTIAPTLTTLRPWSRARSTSGSYEIARSTRPAATCLIGAAGSGGWRISTSRPACSKCPPPARRRCRRGRRSGSSRASARRCFEPDGSSTSSFSPQPTSSASSSRATRFMRVFPFVAGFRSAPPGVPGDRERVRRAPPARTGRPPSAVRITIPRTRAGSGAGCCRAGRAARGPRRRPPTRRRPRRSPTRWPRS